MKYQLCPNSTKIYAFEEKSTHMSEPYLSLSALTHNTTKFKVKIVLATYPTSDAKSLACGTVNEHKR